MKRYVKSDIEIPNPPLSGEDYRFTVPFECHITSVLQYPRSIRDYVKIVFEMLHCHENIQDRYDIAFEILVPTNLQAVNDIILAKVCASAPEDIMECITVLDDTLNFVSFEEPLITYQVDIIIDIEKIGLI